MNTKILNQLFERTIEHIKSYEGIAYIENGNTKLEITFTCRLKFHTKDIHSQAITIHNAILHSDGIETDVTQQFQDYVNSK